MLSTELPQGLIFKTFQGIKEESKHLIVNKNYRLIGPIVQVNRHSAFIMNWLDQQFPKSVIDSPFGSLVRLAEDQTDQIYLALKSCRFILSLKHLPRNICRNTANGLILE
ncbi:unnamed protein product [Didymodactylos carnosus]|uniref:Uncharacterized protein n=1 Tax=Didymodactylos carnosus TaxID=1234261 RepID=A0A814ZHK7_9BILA|nr:unnamed protein product [Didymodactylos carnosus]CAF1469619.1 unnamed protein product [Didymodactylos carnosus]CAF4005207.1 unnamed protein product [Didymodactylos carnosus]CAF4261782.1 unnamed protein product [Didymodactylos carnosus]